MTNILSLATVAPATGMARKRIKVHVIRWKFNIKSFNKQIPSTLLFPLSLHDVCVCVFRLFAAFVLFKMKFICSSHLEWVGNYEFIHQHALP